MDRFYQCTLFKDIEEVIRMGNRTEYGLSAEIYTFDLKKAKEISEKLEAGVISINTDSFSFLESPFGGYKKVELTEKVANTDWKN
ncbi:MAG: aldehyde dehydrogenase family protein [Patescibacteria group bacterium]|nr:aldehyde dehydrogenase family protein [Patescibacteria group bacterium]